MMWIIIGSSRLLPDNAGEFRWMYHLLHGKYASGGHLVVAETRKFIDFSGMTGDTNLASMSFSVPVKLVRTDRHLDNYPHGFERD